jgi:hypothetical protein
MLYKIRRRSYIGKEAAEIDDGSKSEKENVTTVAGR